MPRKKKQNKNKIRHHPASRNLLAPMSQQHNLQSQKNRSVSIQGQAYEGPIPPPAMLAEFEKISPGLADRIVKMAENQAEHRQEIEKIVIKGDNRRANWGQFFAFILGLIGIGGGIFLLYSSKSNEGYTSLVLSTLTLVGVYFKNKSDQKEERKRAREGVTPPVK